MNTLEDWTQAIVGYHKQIEAALPIVERYKMPLGIENHKDWRVDEQVALLERYSSEYLGVSLDTGNISPSSTIRWRRLRSWRRLVTPALSSRPRSARRGRVEPTGFPAVEARRRHDRSHGQG